MKKKDVYIFLAGLKEVCVLCALRQTYEGLAEEIGDLYIFFYYSLGEKKEFNYYHYFLCR